MSRSFRPRTIWRTQATLACLANLGMAAVSSRASTRKLSARTAVQATSVGSSAGSHLQLRPASRARLPLRLPPDVNVRVATETVGGRKIAHNLHRFRTPCRVHAHRPLKSGSRIQAAPLTPCFRLASPSQNVRHDTPRRMRA